MTGPATFRAAEPPREGVVEFTDEGQISRENVWVDLAAILQQLLPN